jgi:adenosine deaminase
MQRLAETRIPLTVCPLSNQRLCVCPDLSQHKLGALLEQGLVATVNSDDPAYFGGYLNENFTQIFAATGLGAAQAYQLAHNSFEASFIDESRRRSYFEQLDGFFEGFR